MAIQLEKHDALDKSWPVPNGLGNMDLSSSYEKGHEWLSESSCAALELQQQLLWHTRRRQERRRWFYLVEGIRQADRMICTGRSDSCSGKA